MAFDVDNFEFSPDILKMSGGNFKAFLKERYGKQYKVKELNKIHDKFYGKLDVKASGDTAENIKVEEPKSFGVVPVYGDKEI